MCKGYLLIKSMPKIINSARIFLLAILIYGSGISESHSQSGNLALSEINEDIIGKAKTTVFIFLSPQCELSKGYVETINYLSNVYASKDLKFYGVVSGKAASTKEIKNFIMESNIAIPLSLDTTSSFAKKLNASITPEVFVVNKKGDVVYKGAIDNWAHSLGQEQRLVTERYLDEVLKSIVSKTKIKIPETTAYGSFIR